MIEDALYLLHIQEAIARIEKYTKAGRKRFLASALIQDATIRNLQTLAESTQKLSEEFKKRNPEVDWRGMAGFRNVMVHHYLSIDLDRVWNVIEKDIPDLKARLATHFTKVLKPQSKPKPKTRQTDKGSRKRKS